MGERGWGRVGGWVGGWGRVGGWVGGWGRVGGVGWGGREGKGLPCDMGACMSMQVGRWRRRASGRLSGNGIGIYKRRQA